MINGKFIVSRASILLMACTTALGLLPGRGHAQANFYEGKTITLIATTAPGGSGDLRIKAVVPFLRKHIPGNPNVVMEYIDGGGGRKGANQLYNNVKPDGLTIGAASGGIVGLGIMREQGVSYDVDKFIYLGTPESENHAIIYTRADLGLDNLEKLRAKAGIRIGGQTVGHTSYVAGRLFAHLMDLKDPKFVVGYTSPEVDVALMNGEVDARANSAVSALRRNPEWLEKRLMHFHAIMEIPKGVKHPRLSHLPEIESFAKNERERRLLTLWRGFRAIGSPYILPPGTPKERVDILEAAMRRIFKDPEFPKYFQKLVEDDPSPLTAADLTRLIRDMPRDAEVQDLLRRISGAAPLPGR
jgi:tripartite-type tricarboxylate transporter receptor subunit TctC